MIRPNRRSFIAGNTAWVSRSGEIMLRATASGQSSGMMSANILGVGPAELLTRMSGAGQAASRAARASAVVTSPTTPVARPPPSGIDRRNGAYHASVLAAADHHVHAFRG